MEGRSAMEIRCPFCHAPLLAREAQVACDVCHTLHHQECWLENFGKCSVFGCDGTRPGGAEATEEIPRRLVVIPGRAARRNRRAARWRRRRIFDRRAAFIFPALVVFFFSMMAAHGITTALQLYRLYALAPNESGWRLQTADPSPHSPVEETRSRRSSGGQEAPFPPMSWRSLPPPYRNDRRDIGIGGYGAFPPFPELESAIPVRWDLHLDPSRVEAGKSDRFDPGRRNPPPRAERHDREAASSGEWPRHPPQP